MTSEGNCASDVLALIDEAVEDWTVSQDAMRWTPAWHEPVVRSPRTPMENLTTAGWDGYAAQAYPAVVLRRGVRNFYREIMKLAPKMLNAAEAMQKLLSAHEAVARKAKPAPFWAVQPQRERRR